jgi:endoglucanase
MSKDFVQIRGREFVVNGEPIILRGWALGSWMNFEHFMMGLPGTNSMIQEAFVEVYGDENAAELFDVLYSKFVREEDIDFLKSIGINSIRIPFAYRHFIDDANPYDFLEKGFQTLDRVVKLCGKKGLHVILDLHSTPGSQNTDWHSDNITGQALFWKYRCFQDQIVKLWRELA